MLTTVASQRTISLWRSRLGSGLRTALACALVACAMLYGPDPFCRLLTYPALSYVAAILIVSDATLGEAVRGATFAAYGTVQGVCPAILSLWVIGPARFSITTTTFAVALSAFVVALPGSTHIVTKRIALVQIVLVYVGAFMQGVRTDAIMHPVHVAISAGVGCVAAVLALILPYPRLGYYEVKEKSKLYAELASKKLKFFTNAFCAENKNSAIASISQAKSLDKNTKKLLQKIKIKQETIQWERPTFKFSPAHFRSPSDRLQTLETPLKGMEIALLSCPTFPIKSADQRLKDHLISITEEIIQTMKQLDYSQRFDSSTAPETAKEFPDKTIQPPQIAFPTLQDLPSHFFLFCMKLLHDEYIASRSVENNTTPDEETAISDKQEPVIMKKKLSIWVMRISGERFIAAFKCSIVLGLSVFFGILFSKNNSYWAGLTVAISLTPFREATFNGANIRAQGTVIGSIYGILGCFISQKYMELRILVLLPWIIFTSFLKDSKMYGQAGGISATVAAIVILGRKDLGDPNEFAIARITETFIGVSCSIFIELLIQPVRASTLAKTRLSESIGAVHECVGSMVFGTHANKSSANLEELKAKEKKLRGHVNALGKIIEEGEIEPSFWFVPFPSTCYRRLLGSLSKMADLLVFGAHAMEFLVHGCHCFGGESWNDMQEHVNGDLEHFKKVVCTPMKCFEEICRMKSLAMLEKEYEKAKNKEMDMDKDKDKEMCEDIEIGKTPKNANGSWNLSGEDEEIEKDLDSFLGNAKENLERVGGGEGEEEMKRGLVLCMGAMGFCMEGLMRETTEIEKGVRELVQWENPTCHVNLHEIYCKLNNACT
ncbi:uncharacterized protein LOC131253878 [Magnolia sinica]|uniref:uncharacterized protein LOC131253878 n=1 Tax=Magnolia sinica TaxID=86752 RepID=UPI00265914F8|nr:uncharacterized protein LOC131253878 [Magnolia sinica]